MTHFHRQKCPSGGTADSTDFVISLMGVLGQLEAFKRLYAAYVIQRLGISAIASFLELPKHTIHSRASGQLGSPEARFPKLIANSASLMLATSQMHGVLFLPTKPIPIASLALGATH